VTPCRQGHWAIAYLAAPVRTACRPMTVLSQERVEVGSLSAVDRSGYAVITGSETNPGVRFNRAARAAFLAALLVAVATAAWLGGRGQQLRSGRLSDLGEKDADFPSYCPGMEKDSDYTTDSTYGYNMDHIPYPEMCCALCQGDEKCTAWVWVKDAGLEGCPSQCWLKGGNLTKKASKKGLVAGIPPKRLNASPTVPVMAKKGEASLLCFALIMPPKRLSGTPSDEGQLMIWQQENNVSIFGCDAWTIYSNQSVPLWPGYKTSTVNSTLSCGFGGDSGTALNSWIFIAVWKKVLSDGTYLKHDWTVKVDADAVFFPGRLRDVLRDHKEDAYLSNCKYGLHGPIEVLSRKALRDLAKDYNASWDGNAPKRCVTEQHFGMYGEDMFIDQCLAKILKVGSHPVDSRIMCEAHCECPEWYWCNNGTDRVVFHPFKTVGSYRNCMANAQQAMRLAA